MASPVMLILGILYNVGLVLGFLDSFRGMRKVGTITIRVVKSTCSNMFTNRLRDICIAITKVLFSGQKQGHADEADQCCDNLTDCADE